MSHQAIDREIAHLEVVFAMISKRDRFPLSYWQQRLNDLRRASLMPAQRARIARLDATLRSLGKPEETAEGSERRSRPRTRTRTRTTTEA